jgi:hypothetical protein
MFAVALIVSLIRVGATATHEFFIEKPHLKSTDTTTSPKLEWLAPDTDANWVVRYRNSAAQTWEESSASVAGRVSNEEMRVRRLYHASLQRLTPGDHFEVEVLRIGEKAFAESGAIPALETHQHLGL